MFAQALLNMKEVNQLLQDNLGSLRSMYGLHNVSISLANHEHVPFDFLEKGLAVMDVYIDFMCQQAGIFDLMDEEEKNKEARIMNFAFSNIKLDSDLSIFIDLMSVLPKSLVQMFLESLDHNQARYLQDFSIKLTSLDEIIKNEVHVPREMTLFLALKSIKEECSLAA